MERATNSCLRAWRLRQFPFPFRLRWFRGSAKLACVEFMKPLRLRTQLFIAALLIILGLTGSLLLFIRHTVNVEIQKSVRNGTEESVHAFENVQRAERV